jgi:siroheme synthase-like protein
MKHRGKESKLFYPVFLDVAGKRCLVIGGGQLALRKVTALLECRADVTVVSPSFDPEFRGLKGKGAVELIERRFVSGDLTGAAIVIAATDERETNRKIAEKAKKRRALVNVVDDAESSDFIVPSFFRRGDLMIAVSTAGLSPAFAKKIRATLEESLGDDFARLLSLVGEVRSELKRKKVTVTPRAWQESLDLDRLISLVRAGRGQEVKKILVERIRSFAMRP